MEKKYDHKRRASAEYRFFCFDPDNDGMMFFRSEEGRDRYAKDAIRGWHSDGEGWSEEVESICTGIVTHTAQKTNVVKRPPPEEFDEEGCDGSGLRWDVDWEYMCDYELIKLSEQPGQPPTGGEGMHGKCDKHGCCYEIEYFDSGKSQEFCPECRKEQLSPLIKSLLESQCPVCGYYCTGNGGFGCIDKKSLMK